MKITALLLLLVFNAHGLNSTLNQDFSKNQLEKMGGTYISELYLFLDGSYCDKNRFCVRAYLAELLRIKKGVWASEFIKEGQGVYSKLNIMEEDSPIACDVTLEVEGPDTHYFNIYCDH